MFYVKALFFVCFGFFYSNYVNSSDFGTTGLVDIPTARMSSDGTLLTTAAIQSRTNSYAITYQATPWLEGTFRYTGLTDTSYTYDRNYETKFRLLREDEYLPQVAVGIRDLVGTGLWGSEYVVASKKISNFDITLGIGWGRLAGKGDFRNPLTFVSDSFEERVLNVGLGGELASGAFFSGEESGVFGGISYQLESLPVSLMLEYNPDQYFFEVARGGREPDSPISAAVKWDAAPGLSLTLSRQHNQEWGMQLTAALDTKSLPPKPARRLYMSSIDLESSDLPKGISQNSWYDTFLFDAERSGLLLLEATVDESLHTATIVMGNMAYPVWIDAVDYMVNLADLHLPTTVNMINIVVEEEGHRINTIRMRRPSLNFGKNRQLVEREIRIEPFNAPSFVQHRTDFVQKKILLDINLSNRVQLFDPDDPARYQLYAKIGLSMMLPGNWVLGGAIDRDITNNFDESTRQSDSVLTRVRSDVVRYLNEGESGLDSLYVQKRGNLFKDTYFRVFGGVLESMYSGVGGEVVYQPLQSRLAFGLSANWLKQRDYDKTLKHLEYQTATAFASAYWASPFYNFDVAVHAGKYLARDVGATLEVRRTFDNGWMVGLWATKTNVSAEDFGEGSFDKGLFFKIPFNGFLGTSSRSNYTTRVRPIQRDGGQYLEDFMSRIWWDLRGTRYDAFSQSMSRLSR
jgi:hypothetical protein